MKILLVSGLIFLLICSCSNSNKSEKLKAFTTLDFSYDDVFTTCFSIKFNQSDTVFIRQHFASIFSDTLKRNQSYFALLADTERQKLESFISEIDFTMLDTSYYQSYEDGISYQFYIDKGTLQKTIYVHSDSVPENIKDFALWLVDLKEKSKKHPVDQSFEFGSAKYFLPPEASLSTTKFLPPQEE